MPELPEVETIRRQLEKEIVGAKIVNLVSLDDYRTESEFEEFRERLKGLKVLSVQRVAKTIVIELEPSARGPLAEPRFYLVIHLAMTGRLLLRSVGFRPDPWMRMFISLEFPQGHPAERGGLRELRFTDPRRFGYVKLLTSNELPEHREKYGPDPLDEGLTTLKFLNRLRLKKTVVKKALLQQELMAGVGNIYANESLWQGRIHPETPTEKLTESQGSRLLAALREVLREGIKNRGSTLSDGMYVDLYGRGGEQQNFFRVFGRTNKPCPRCQSLIIQKEIGGRQTFFCPECQRKPVDTKQVTRDTKNFDQTPLI